MSGRKSFANLKSEVEATPERRARLEKERQFVNSVIGLTAIREARGTTQQEIADAWDVSQANVSQIERTADIHLSTLRRYISALGGHIEIRAVFPDGAMPVLSDGESADAEVADRPAPPPRSHDRVVA